MTDRVEQTDDALKNSNQKQRDTRGSCYARVYWTIGSFLFFFLQFMARKVNDNDVYSNISYSSSRG